MNLSERNDKYFPAPKSNRGFNPSTFIETLILIQHEGIFHLDDTRYLNDNSALRNVLGLTKILQASPLVIWLCRLGNDAQSTPAWSQMNKRVIESGYTQTQRLYSGY